MEWVEIVKIINENRDKFEKSYKCVNRSTPIRVETLFSHIDVILLSYNNIVQLYSKEKSRLTGKHLDDCLKIIHSLGRGIRNIGTRHNIIINVPKDLLSLAVFDRDQLQDLNESKPNIGNSSDSETEPLIDDSGNNQTRITMTDSGAPLRAYMREINSSIPNFDGQSGNLKQFIQALNMIKKAMGPYEETTVEVIKTKVDGVIFNLIENLTTVEDIIKAVKETVKGPSTYELIAQMNNVTQKGKTANEFVRELEAMRAKVEAAHINEGFSFMDAKIVSTRIGVDVLRKNSEQHPRLRGVMDARFTTMGDATGAYVEMSNKISGGANVILFSQRGKGFRGNFHNNRGRGSYHGNSYGNGNYQGSYHGNSYGNGNYQGNRRENNYQRQNNYRGNSRGNYRGNRNRNNRGNVRITQGNSENLTNPSSALNQ